MKRYDLLSEAIEATKRNKIKNVIILNCVVIYEYDNVVKIITNDKIIYKIYGLSLTLERDTSERAIL